MTKRYMLTGNLPHSVEFFAFVEFLSTHSLEECKREVVEENLFGIPRRKRRLTVWNAILFRWNNFTEQEIALFTQGPEVIGWLHFCVCCRIFPLLGATLKWLLLDLKNAGRTTFTREEHERVLWDELLLKFNKMPYTPLTFKTSQGICLRYFRERGLIEASGRHFFKIKPFLVPQSCNEVWKKTLFGFHF